MIETEHAKVFHGSNLDVLPTLADNSIDAIVTDPPYELGFMGKSWDSSGIAYSVELWSECMRVLKPGGHLLAFGGSRTWHRLAVAIEDAGFEMRDSIAWLYGSGFPKSMNVAKAIEGLLTTGSSQKNNFHQLPGDKDTNARIGMWDSAEEQGFRKKNPEQLGAFDLEATTPEAIKWQGWGTALKPAFEPVVVARKPFKGTVASNVLEWGVGGLNIDGSRIGRADGDNSSAGNRTATFGTQDTQSGGDGSGGWEQNSGGRWPANIILDPYTAELLDEQSGILKSGALKAGRPVAHTNVDFRQGLDVCHYESEANSGGASRFFYVAKASKRDRNEGLEELEEKYAAAAEFRPNHMEKALEGESGNPFGRFQPVKNFHPTVKPTSLMRYLVKLVTPPNGTVLDPFTGSGSTGKAAILEGFNFVGIELTEDYLPIIKGRLEHAEATLNADATEQEQEQKETLF